MATLTFNFNPQTDGEHIVGYRTVEDPALTYNTISVMVVDPSISQSVIIPLTGNLFCADIDVDTYVLARCENPGLNDGNADGIPDNAVINSTITVPQQVDPCILTEITCDNVGIDSVEVTVKGAGYTSAPTVSFVGGGGGAGATATALLGDGVITTVPITSVGPYAYPEPDGTLVGIPLIGLGQVATTGVGATVDVTIVSGEVTAIVLNSPGSGYISTESVLTLAHGSLPGGPPVLADVQVTVTCANSFADEVNNVNVTAPGSGFTSIPTVSFAGGAGAGVTATATMELSPNLNLDLYDCADTDGDNSIYNLVLGDSVSVCADRASFGTNPLASNFVSAEIAPCHCVRCRRYSVRNDSAAPLRVTYQTCWDGYDTGALDFGGPQVELNTISIAAGVTEDLGCVIEGTLSLEDSTNMTITQDIACF